ncbi:hypothetical protein SODALDRAFT_361343 [Sodiomyces alkalinus F11]|uniref:Uncharacterized protein n=1 Tax=Sodiomyces alkalinus (strain CBS 110278 / VKM F-3762 / F11) TaxID=1314773 RepID=A0A3N2PSY4_SODAK|nr:hypothetical protein SODALDRAFT_361343 [Sodiomyces alkalinus F11]ROT37617.1 hypothetical protein SODALDRAFT_361343 [Sodiomyces alkalinus F11]
MTSQFETKQGGRRCLSFLESIREEDPSGRYIIGRSPILTITTSWVIPGKIDEEQGTFGLACTDCIMPIEADRTVGLWICTGDPCKNLSKLGSVDSQLYSPRFLGHWLTDLHGVLADYCDLPFWATLPPGFGLVMKTGNGNCMTCLQDGCPTTAQYQSERPTGPNEVISVALPFPPGNAVDIGYSLYVFTFYILSPVDSLDMRLLVSGMESTWLCRVAQKGYRTERNGEVVVGFDIAFQGQGGPGVRSRIMQDMRYMYRKHGNQRQQDDIELHWVNHPALAGNEVLAR